MDQWGMGGRYKGTPNSPANESASSSHVTPGVCVIYSMPSYTLPTYTITRCQGTEQHETKTNKQT